MDPASPVTLTLNILLADDHEVMRLAMRHAVQPLAAEIRWFEAADAAQVESHLASGVDFDLALIDLNMPGAEGASTIARLRREHPALPLVILSPTEDRALVRELIALGVSGFVPKSDAAEVMLQAIRLILAGGTYAPLRFLSDRVSVDRAGEDAGSGAFGLTSRQIEVLRLLARGLPNKVIARELGLAEATVKVHLLAIFRVLQARNRAMGAAPGGDRAVVVYAITGRSPSSQARKLVLRDGGVWVQPTDEETLKKGNVDLLVYSAMLFAASGLAVSNGKQTADIRSALPGAPCPVAVLSKALSAWDFEPARSSRRGSAAVSSAGRPP